MAIAKLVNVGYQKSATSEPRRAFHYTDKDKSQTSEKVSSSMFSDSMVSSVIESIRSYNSQIAKLQDISRGLIISFKGLIVMIKQLNRDMTTRFRSLNKELDASRLDFVRSVLTPAKSEERTVGASLAAEQPTVEETKKEDPKKEDEKSNFLDGLMGLLGVGRKAGAAKDAGLLRSLGTVIANPIVAGFLGASAATVAAIFGSALVGDYLMDKLGINKLIAEREKSEEYQQLRRTQEDITDRSIERNVGAVREQRAQTITDFLKSKGLGGPQGVPKGDEIRKIGDNVTIIKKGHPDEGKTFNFMTGQQIGAPEVQGPPAPAAAPTGTPQQATSGSGSSQPAAGSDRPTTPPTQSGGTEGTAPSAPPAASSGGGMGAPAATPTPTAPAPAQSTGSVPKEDSGASGAGQPQAAGAPQVQGPPMPPEAGPPKSAAARKREALDSLGAPAPATPAPTAPPAPPETPKMESSGAAAPVVVNNNNVQATSASSGGEGNNVTGQNFALSAVDPFINQYLSKTAQLADSTRSQ